MITRSLSRRALLRSSAVVAGGAVVAGCANPSTSPSAQPATGTGTTSPGPDDTDVAILTAAIDDEATLLRLCTGISRRYPQLAPVVGPIVRLQREHVRRLASSLTEPPDVTARPVPVPPTTTAAERSLRNHVSAAEQARMTDCLDVTSGLLARLLASVSASHAVTVEDLRGRP